MYSHHFVARKLFWGRALVTSFRSHHIFSPRTRRVCPAHYNCIQQTHTHARKQAHVDFCVAFLLNSDTTRSSPENAKPVSARTHARLGHVGVANENCIIGALK